MIISRKRFDYEVNRRVDEALDKDRERSWREERERDMSRAMRELETRLIEVEKKNGIDHPSHHNGKACIC